MNKRETLHAALVKLQQANDLLRHLPGEPDIPVKLEMLLQDAITDIHTVLGIKRWPEPTTDEPDLETLEEWMLDGACEATDGCLTEPDGTCMHGYPSWLLQLGLN